ncbi:hypothetical protein QBC40DRAFT_346632 [Triangularia verruculosa]|uniref:Uncharacterized protein n=1 Tax=Triangularia verruculosa TaxID=2587418 RepID=A0AAN6XSD8_9PEZI|nr:hypothetical protein QBC40DRAFT_346632 [Triangularia verruculosa]
MHISRTVITTIALAATGSALPASNCGSGTCPHNGDNSNSRLASGENQGTQQGQQGQQRFDKSRENENGVVAPRSHSALFAHSSESGNQMSGNGNTGLYDKSDNYFGKKEFDHDKLQLSATGPAGPDTEGISGGIPDRYSKEQQFQPRSEISSELRKNNDGQQQQHQGQESGQLMTTLDKIRELLFGSQQQKQQQQQQKLERQQEGKGNTHLRRSEIQDQGSMGSGIQGQRGRFESGTYEQNGVGQERQRLRGQDVEQPLRNNYEEQDDGIASGQRGNLRLDRGDGRRSNNGQVAQGFVDTGDDKQRLTMKGQDTLLENSEVPAIVITQHEKVQPRGQGQSASKGSDSANIESPESTKFVNPAQMLENKPQQQPTMQQSQEPDSVTFDGNDNQLLNKGDNNQGHLSGRDAEHPMSGSSMLPDPIAEKNDGSSGSSEEEGEDQKAEKVLGGSSDVGKQWGQTEAKLASCLYLAGQQGDISMLRDCFNNDASKMQNPLDGQQRQRFDGSTGQESHGQVRGGKTQA